MIKNALKNPDLKISELKKSIFEVHSVAETLDDLEKMFLAFMCSDEAEHTIERQTTTVSYLQIKKILSLL